MIPIQYPPPGFRIKTEKGKEYLFDAFRKKWVLLTPEEWVRQNFIQYLVRVLQYPANLIALEKEIRLGELRKRFDILVYGKNHQPWMMVECKAMEVALHDSVIQQLLRYHISVPVPYLVITNGNQCYAWKKTEKGFMEMDKFPVEVGG